MNAMPVLHEVVNLDEEDAKLQNFRNEFLMLKNTQNNNNVIYK